MTDYYSGDIKLSRVWPIDNQKFTELGGIKLPSNYYDGFQRLVGGVNDSGAIYCVTRKVYFKKTRAPHKCNKRCLNARGFECECECGGANHGKGAEFK